MLLNDSLKNKPNMTKKKRSRNCRRGYNTDWGAIDIKQHKHERSLRQRQRTRDKRASVVHVSLSKPQRAIKRRQQLAACDTAACKRRALLLYPDGMVSPMRLLPHTTNPRGVVGSLLGGKPVALAFNPLSKVVAMGLQDSICDEMWCDGGDAHSILEETGMQLNEASSDGIYGIVLLLRLRQCQHTGAICIGDLPLHREVYHHMQVHAPVDDTALSSDSEEDDGAR